MPAPFSVPDALVVPGQPCLLLQPGPLPRVPCLESPLRLLAANADNHNAAQRPYFRPQETL